MQDTTWLRRTSRNVKYLQNYVLDRYTEIAQKRRKNRYDSKMRFSVEELSEYIDLLGEVVFKKGELKRTVNMSTLIINGIHLDDVLYHYVKLLHLMGLDHAVEGLSKAFATVVEELNKVQDWNVFFDKFLPPRMIDLSRTSSLAAQIKNYAITDSACDPLERQATSRHREMSQHFDYPSFWEVIWLRSRWKVKRPSVSCHDFWLHRASARV